MVICFWLRWFAVVFVAMESAFCLTWVYSLRRNRAMRLVPRINDSKVNASEVWNMRIEVMEDHKGRLDECSDSSS